MAIEVKLPALGDGIQLADVLEILVKVGDQVTKDQGIVEVETDKATVQVPTNVAGKISQIHVSAGQTITIGSLLVTLETQPVATGPAARPPIAAPPSVAPPPITAAPPIAAASSVAPPPIAAAPSTPAPATAPPKPVSPTGATAPAKSRGPTDPGPVSQSTASSAMLEVRSEGNAIVPAGPAVRRFAREVGVDPRGVKGTGPGGRITREDLLEVVRHDTHAAHRDAAAGTSRDAWGVVRIERLSKVRRTIAEKMRESWTTVARVTNFDDADVTDLEQIRQASKADYASKGIKLTALPFILKSVAMSLKAHPRINASLDIEHDQVIYKDYVSIGIAVDSDRGLTVPVVRQVDLLSISEIARAIAGLSEKVRNSDFAVDELRGGTFTVSNLGAVGGTYSTPIVNVPEVAILLVGKSRKVPVVIDDQIVPRLVMPLSLSYDHRLVDGAAAARFLNDVIGYLEAPSRLLLAP